MSSQLTSEALGTLCLGWQVSPLRCRQFLQGTGQARSFSIHGLAPPGPSYVGAQLCALLVGDVGGQGVYDVEQQLLTQGTQRGQLGDLQEVTKRPEQDGTGFM